MTLMTFRTDEEQVALVRAFVRKFNAEIVPSEEAKTEREEVRRCVICRRSNVKLVLGADERWWCPNTESETCNRIAQSRLGGATSGSASALHGILRKDGTCRDCGADIKWVRTQRGKKMPVDTSPAPAGVAAFELVGAVRTLAFYVSEKKRKLHSSDVYQSHFQSCPDRIIEDGPT
jgi:hypothetical protein